ncbi:MAG: MMPL family transporter [Solirubrobacteraceae bacterium]
MQRLADLLLAGWVRVQLLVLCAAVAGVVWIGLTLPPLAGESRNAADSLVPNNSSALQAERMSAERFAFPLLTRTLVVVRNPHGLPTARQASLIALAARLSLGHLSGYREIAGALPLLNSLDGPPFAREHSTSAILYLYFRPGTSSGRQLVLARRLLRRVIGRLPGEYDGVTGEIPALATQESVVEEHLNWVEVATVLLVALAVALRFRSVGAALLVVATVVAAYVVSDRVVALLGRSGGIALPAEMGPVLIVLVMGVATDYSIFFLSRFRTLIAEGRDRRAAAAAVVRQITPVVLAAGFTVAAGTASLLVANLTFLRDFGPGLAVAVLIAMLTAVILVPAVLAVAGERLYWPRAPQESHSSPATPPRPAPEQPARYSPVRLAARHPLIAFVLATAIVLAGASGLGRIAVGNEMIDGLPATSPVQRAALEARQGFAAGVIAPTVLVVSGHALGSVGPQLERLQELLAAQPGVAQVLGARQLPPLAMRTGLPGRVGSSIDAGLSARGSVPVRAGLAISFDGRLARFLLFLRRDPLGAGGLSDVQALQGRLPALLRRAGLAQARGLLGGDSALSAELVHDTFTDLGRVTPVMLAAIFLILALYLRALVAPIYLVLTSVLAVLCALGLTVYVMQDALGYGQITYYVIFTTAVLLVSLGSDYNVFLIGRIWQQGRSHSLRRALEVAGPRAARPIAVAGLVLAGAFALLALVPLRAFREIAFAMGTGLLIDAFIVRAILIPALVALVGPRSAWPRRLAGENADQAASAAID